METRAEAAEELQVDPDVRAHSVALTAGPAVAIAAVHIKQVGGRFF